MKRTLEAFWISLLFVMFIAATITSCVSARGADMEPLLIITNGVALSVTQDTNLIAAGRFYPNGIEAPYILHHPRIDTNHTILFTYQSNRYQWTFKTEPGVLQTNVSIKTPIP